MSESQGNSRELEIMLAEIHDLRLAEREFLMSADKFITLANAGVVGGLTLGLVNQQRIALVAIPFGLMAIYIFMIQIYTERFSRAGHRMFLEEIVNSRLSETVLLEQVAAAKLRDNRGSVKLSSIVYVIALAGSVVLAWQAVAMYRTDHPWIAVSFIVGLIIAGSTLLVAVLEMWRAESATYSSVKFEHHRRWIADNDNSESSGDGP